ncbi:MAG: hypothetical protein EXQ47_06330 [Bryobacterales bacterium]|nr:hypothetical protein [Bryobacterales bacterium]
MAMLCAGDDTVGVGAIKQPRQGYARGIAGADKSGFAFDPQMNELGYVAVLAAHRGGRSGQIMNSLLERFNISLWATTSDELMKHSLRNRGFLQKGNEWLNAKGKKLSLWLRYSK